MNKRVLVSLSVIAAVAALAVGGTIAYFSDTETSTGNTFTAGELDLKVDNTCYYNKVADGTPNCPWTTYSSWSESDLVPGVHKFFMFEDVKPSDYGEDTISLHVYHNDAWGRLVISTTATSDSDVTCTEPELEAEPNCTPTGDGELREALRFWIWLDQGKTPGFQGRANGDPFEGDNIYQPDYEPMLITEGPIDATGEVWPFSPGLAMAYQTYQCSGTQQPPDRCKGLNDDGHMTGSVTYYFGVAWKLPEGTGNEVQSDSFGGDMTLEVTQYRNQPVDPYVPR